MLMHQRPPKDLPVSVLTIVVIVLISSFGVEAQQSRTRSNGPSGSSGASDDRGTDGRIADTVDDEALPRVNGSLAAGICAQCSIRNVTREYSIEAIKADIMRKLRLNNLPNVTGRRLPDIPHLRQILESNTLENDLSRSMSEVDDIYSVTTSVINFAQTVGNSNVFTFNLTSDLANQQVVNATMGIYIRGPTAHTGLVNTWILVYRVRPLPAQERVLIHRRRVIPRDLGHAGQWFTFNMKSHVEYAMQHPSAAIGFIVHASNGRGEPLAIINPRNETEEVLKPYLEIHSRDRGTSRNKRTIDLDCDESSAESRCCRYPFIVDFEEFGWDWIVHPRRYSKYYCSGECPFLNPRYPPTNPVQKLGLCCSPSKVSGLQLLYYYTNTTIIHSTVPDMVVDQCGCS